MSFNVFYPPSGGGSSANASVGINGDPSPGSSTLVAGQNPSGDQQPLQTNASGDLLVEINAETSGLATLAEQQTQTGILTNIDSSTSSIDSKITTVDTNNVTVVSSTLPIGAATESEQQTQTGILSSIDTSVALGATEATLSTLNSKVVAVDTNNVTVISTTLPTGAATEATLAAFSDKTAAGIVPEAFDYQDITYVGATTDINTVVYKLGGAGGTTVATLTMGYDGSNRLTSVTKT